MNETGTGNKTNIGITDEITRNQRTYVTIQDNKHVSSQDYFSNSRVQLAIGIL